jgi:hypothetical protein
MTASLSTTRATALNQYPCDLERTNEQKAELQDRATTQPPRYRPVLGVPLFPFAGEYAAGNGDVFATGFLGRATASGKRLLFTYLGKQPAWEIDSASTSIWAAHAEIARLEGVPPGT